MVTKTTPMAAGDFLVGYAESTSAFSIPFDYISTVLGISGGLDPSKLVDPVVVVTTTNITLANEQTYSGVGITAGDRVLVAGQTVAADNGFYTCVDGGAWTRTSDDIDNGTFAWTVGGTPSPAAWVCVTVDPIVVGTTNLVFRIGQFVTSLGIPDIAGLQAALDLKASTDHNHTGVYAPIAHVTNYDNPHGVSAEAIGAVPDTRLLVGQHSIAAIGDLSADRNLNLVNDVASPGADKVYGTNSSGVRGWQAVSASSHPTDHSASEVSVDAAGAVARTLAARFADFKNVLDFGAVCDGSTNDRAAFVAAITAAAVAGGTVYIPAGSYRVGASGDATLSIPSNVSIHADQKAIIDWRGTGYCLTLTGGTMLSFSGGQWQYANATVDANGERGIWKVMSTAGNITRCVWSHLYIIGNTTLEAEDYGFWISGSQEAGQAYSAYYNTIAECRIDYCQQGIRFWPGGGAQYNSQPNAWNVHDNLFFQCFYDVAFPKNTGAVRYFGTDEFTLRGNFHASTGGSSTTGGAILIEGWENQEDAPPAPANRGPIYIDVHDSIENAGRGLVVTGAEFLKLNSFVFQPANTYGAAIVTDYTSTGGAGNALPPGNSLTINTRRVDWPLAETPIANGTGATNPASLETMRVWANNVTMTCASATNIKFIHFLASASNTTVDAVHYIWHADGNCTYIDASETVLASPEQLAGTVEDWPNFTASVAIRTPGYKRYTPSGGEIVQIKWHAGAGAAIVSPVNIARESPLKTVAISGATKDLSGQEHQGKLLQNTEALTLTITSTTDFSAFAECQLYAAGGAITVAAGSGVTIHKQGSLVVPENGRALILATDAPDTYVLSILETAASSGAPTDAAYWTSSANGSLSAEVNLGGLTSGLLKHTVSDGVSTPATAVANTDYAPSASPTFTGTVTVPDASFANAKLANMAQDTIKGRKTASTGAPEDCTAAETRAIIEKSPSRVISSVSGSLTTAAHNGAILLTSGNVTVPNAAGDVGFSATLVMGGAHTITFNSTVSAAMASGDIVTLIVTSTTTIKAVKTAAANLVSFT